MVNILYFFLDQSKISSRNNYGFWVLNWGGRGLFINKLMIIVDSLPEKKDSVKINPLFCIFMEA